MKSTRRVPVSFSHVAVRVAAVVALSMLAVALAPPLAHLTRAIADVPSAITGQAQAAVLLSPTSTEAASQASPTWADVADTSWFTGEADSYTLTTSEQLAGLAALVDQGQTFEGVTVTLGAAIDLSAEDQSDQALLWSMPSIQAPFSGTLDGGGYAIEGLQAEGECAALFGSASGATFWDVEVAGTVEASSLGAGLVCVAQQTQFEGCQNAVTVHSAASGATLGGLAAQAVECTFNGCTNSGALSAAMGVTSQVAGGLAGAAKQSTFQSCEGAGYIQSADVAGGCVGLVKAASETTSFTQCTSSASVTASQVAGGVVGRAEGPVSIDQAVNQGSIQGGNFGYAGAAFAGGFVGDAASSSASVSITSSYNAGSAWSIAGSDSGSSSCAAGFVASAAAPVTISSSYDVGPVSATGGADNASGVFVGQAASGATTTLSGCFYENDVAKSAVGESVSVAGVPVEKTAEQMPYIVADLGSDFCYASAYRATPQLTWMVNSVDLTYVGASGQTLQTVGVQSGASLSTSDVKELYAGPLPTEYLENATATFCGWASSEGGEPGAAFTDMDQAQSVYAAFTVVEDAPTPSQGSDSSQGGSGTGSTSSSGDGSTPSLINPIEPTNPIDPLDSSLSKSIQKQVDHWVKQSGTWWYKHADGSYTKDGWERINGAWYYFDHDGWLYTGWLHQGDVWYYLTAGGEMAENWEKVDGSWYYFSPSSGVMQTGWKHLGGSWYYLNSSGAMATGWKSLSGIWYRFDASGKMLTGWQKVNGTWYYFDHDGAMAHDVTIGGYHLSSSGAWVR